ncbi:MAG: hypothetical protein CM1200mP18_12660 [Gammaproteobacteria bacterium]|nr:MAG: hypothetical protein CM1200mP18_12660 [Gammaproteobacteria bacterium]
MKRRVFLNGSFAVGAIAVAAAAGLLTPRRLLAASWPETAFDAKNEADAVKALFGDMPVVESDAITIKAPLQAENGAVVPVKASTSLPNAESIAIVVEKKTPPLGPPQSTSCQVPGDSTARELRWGRPRRLLATSRQVGKYIKPYMS